MNRYLVLTLNGFREARRNRVTTVVLVFAAAMLLFSTVSMSLTVATFDRVLTDFGLGTMALISAFLTIFLASGLVPKEIERRTIFMVLAKPLSRTSFIIGRYLGNVLTVSVITVAMALIFVGQMLIQHGELNSSHLAAVIGLILQIVLLTAVAFVLAAFASQFVTAIVSVSLYFMGHLASELYSMAARSKAEALQWVGKALYYVIPNLDRLNFTDRATYGDPTTAGELVSATLYTVAYAAVMLAIASAIFERRDFK